MPSELLLELSTECQNGDDARFGGESRGISSRHDASSGAGTITASAFERIGILGRRELTTLPRNA